MRPGDMTSGPTKLRKAWQKLQAHWELAQVDWHDPVSRELDEKYLAPLEPQIAATLERMASLGGMLSSAEQECKSEIN